MSEQKHSKKLLGAAVTASLAVVLAAGSYVFLKQSEPGSSLEGMFSETPKVSAGLDGIREDGELVVLTVASPTTYQKRGSDVFGYEVDLTRELSESLGVDVRYRLYRNLDRMTKDLEAGRGHIAAPGMSQREMRLDADIGDPLVFGPAYKNVRPELICRKGGARPDTLADISEYEVGVVAGSGVEETLEVRAEDNDDLQWTPIEAVSGMPLAKRVENRVLDCAILDSNLVAIAKRRFPNLVTRLTVGAEDRAIAWRLAPQSADLNTYLRPWFDEAHQEGLLYDLDERYYGHLNDFDYLNIATFRKRIDSRLPTYEETFRSAAGQNDLDWTMLASQAYQESHWDPDARSPTGVRGLMMLTRPTARELGIANRLDPEQSIRGGAEYLDRMYNRLPESVTGYDRLWMAMAAYNVGYGHLLDARRLAARQGLDKDKWRVIDDMLPLLTKKAYYTTVPHGYARGYEPVRYVRRIREYDDVLTENVPDPEQPPFSILSQSGANIVVDAPPEVQTAENDPALSGGEP